MTKRGITRKVIGRRKPNTTERAKQAKAHRDLQAKYYAKFVAGESTPQCDCWKRG